MTDLMQSTCTTPGPYHHQLVSMSNNQLSYIKVGRGSALYNHTTGLDLYATVVSERKYDFIYRISYLSLLLYIVACGSWPMA
jgi:hypothetical protein